MKMKYTLIRKWTWLLSLVLLAGGCSKPIYFNSTTPSKVLITTPITLVHPSQTFTATPSLTALPSLLSRSSPTWTPVPPLPYDKAQAVLTELYINNGGCELPCWWGITPGKNTWQQINTLLSPLGRISPPRNRQGIISYEIYLLKPKDFMVPTISAGGYDDNYFSPWIFVKDGTVLTISINSGWISRDFDYSLAAFLKMLGKPGEIRLKVIMDLPPENSPEYYMDLFYADKGILISTNGTAEGGESTLRICPQEYRNGVFPPALTLWSPSLKITYDEVPTSLFAGIGEWNPSEYHLLDDLTNGFGSAEFYKTFVDANATKCFEINKKQ
jgi:hypothetical protein